MFFKRRTKSSETNLPTTSSETIQETMQRRAKEYISTLQYHYPREYEKLVSEVENGDLARAKLTLRGLASIMDEGYIDPIIQQLQTQA